jgi:hypothetical protein
MPDGRNAKFLEVIPGQTAENFAVDLVLTERRTVLAEPKAPRC